MSNLQNNGLATHKRSTSIALGLVWVWSILLLAAVPTGCGDGGASGYFPIHAGSQWVMENWRKKELPDGQPEVLGWDYSARVVGSAEIQGTDWRVVELTAGEEPYTVMMRSDGDSLSVLGMASGTYSGDPASLIMPDSGPLQLTFTGLQVHDFVPFDFHVDDGGSSEHVIARLEVESIGSAIDTGTRQYDDGLTLRFSTNDPDSGEEQEPWLRLFLARGHGLVHVEHHTSSDLHWGDIAKR